MNTTNPVTSEHTHRASRSAALGVGVFTLAIALGPAARGAEAADGADGSSMAELLISGKADPQSDSATGLDLTLRETPQSVTVIDRQRMQDFGLTTANSLLDQVPGINVERVETDRTYYNSRGFDITNFQFDGIGMPLIWGNQFGDLDTALFERVEAIRGATGLLTATGNPSAAINFVRKRPTDTFQAFGSLAYGSWADRRLEADVSGPLDAAATLKARAVYAHEDRASYLDYNHVDRDVFYGVVSWEVSARLTGTLGYSQQDNLARGVMWGALPLEYSDGSPVNYPVSASSSASWTYWNVYDKQGFAELNYRIAQGWEAKLAYTHKVFQESAKLLYAFTYPDPQTGLGVLGMTGTYPSDYAQDLLNLTVAGNFGLFGREHQVVVGVSGARSHGLEWEGFSTDYPAYPAVQLWGQQQAAEPAYPTPVLQADITDKIGHVYGALHLSATDRLKAVVGFSTVRLTTEGVSYGVDQGRNATNTSPYLGLIYDFSEHLSAYASYADIFNPQSEVDINHRRLDPATGRTYEAGLKSEWFRQHLYATAAVFKSDQYNLAQFAGNFENSVESYYTGVDTFVRGYELEVAGGISDHWQVSGGWTQLSIDSADGAPVRSYEPRRSLKLQTTYALPELRDLKLGAALRWQSEVSMVDLVPITQASYWVVDLMGAVRLAEHLRACVELRNVADKKYLASLLWNQAYYAQPRSVMVTVDWRL